jgi:hypothetical protein
VPKLDDVHWVGAARGGTWFWTIPGSPAVADNAWEGGGPPLGGDGCAYANNLPARLDNAGANCSDSERYMCTWPVR